jgi:nitrogen-specific signal transduction histidine kinase/CheY-like chemotaxis protein
MNAHQAVEQKKDYYEDALHIGATLDLANTCEEALKVCAHVLDLPLITLEILDEESKSILGMKLQHKNDKAIRDVERVPHVEPIGKFGLVHFEIADLPDAHKLGPLLYRRIELAWRSCLQQRQIEITQAALDKRRDMDRKISKSLSHVTNNQELSTEIEVLLELIVDTEFTATYFLNQENNELELCTAKGFEDWEMKDALKTAWFRHPGHVLRTGQVIDVPDTLLDHQNQTSTSMRRHKIRSRLFIPVRLGNNVIGALGLASSKPDYFTDGHRDILNFMADLAGLTWGRIREEKGRERRELMLHTNAKISSLLMTTPNFHDVAKSVLELLTDAIDAPLASIVEFSPKSQSTKVVASCPTGSQIDVPMSFCEEHMDAFLRGEEITSSNQSNYNFANDDDLDHMKMIGVPLVSGGITRGALVVKCSVRCQMWADVAFDMVKQVANAIAAADSRSRLETRLRHSQKLEAIGTLAGGIAHEFNNLLWPILSYTQLLKERISEPSMVDMLKEIEKASTRATKQVSQVLDGCRLNEPDIEVVHLKSAIEDSLQFMERSVPASIKVKAILEDAGNANIDVAGLYQVILNVSNNACQAMHGSGTLTVRLTKLDEESAILEISDDGHGMNDHTRSRMFNAYFSTKTSEEGTGLGMSIVQRIIEDMGGNITITSALNKGTRVRIELPLINECTEIKSAPKNVTMSDLDAPYDGIMVYIVDDDDAVRTMCVEIIESFNYQVEPFADPRDLLTAFTNNEQKPRVIITDLSMPIMDGIELTKVIRETDRDVPIICCTGFGSDDLEREAIETGVTAFARKPLRVEDFGQLLKDLIVQKLPL